MILAAEAGDAGAYYAQAVNERTGENRTSPPVLLSVVGESRNPPHRPESRALGFGAQPRPCGAFCTRSEPPGAASRVTADRRSAVASCGTAGRKREHSSRCCRHSLVCLEG